MRGRICLTLATLALFFGLTATEPAPSASAQATWVDVAMVNFAFEPGAIDVPAGLVTFNLQNAGTSRHDMVVDVNGVVMESETYAGGEGGLWEIMLDQPGTYAFWCSIGNHRERGMEGVLTVQ